jgi:hypothetical protein
MRNKSARRQVVVGLVAVVAITGFSLGGISIYKSTRETGGECDSNFNCPFGHKCISDRCALHCDTEDDCPRGSECTRAYLTYRSGGPDYDSDQQAVCWPPRKGETRAALREKNKKPAKPIDPKFDARLSKRVRRALEREIKKTGRTVADTELEEFDEIWSAMPPNVKRSHGVVELAYKVADELDIELPPRGSSTDWAPKKH